MPNIIIDPKNDWSLHNTHDVKDLLILFIQKKTYLMRYWSCQSFPIWKGWDTLDHHYV
jgi:hypothetical protein